MLWVFYKHAPLGMPVPENRGGMKANDFIYPIFMLTEVPHLLKGFLIVAILSAAMSSVSSALTSLASVSTMDFVKHFVPRRGEEFFLRFSKVSTIGWAVLLVAVAYLSREVTFVFNAAFSLRGLTSGALLGGVLLAVFWKRRSAIPVVAGMLAALIVMTAIEIFPKWSVTQPLWQRVIGEPIFWPWYTLIGVGVMLVTAWLVSLLLPAPGHARRG